MGIFGDAKKDGDAASGRIEDFAYLKTDDIYMDSACQSLRPTPVTDALNEYYTDYNACGGRVKYAWGQKVDDAVESTRAAVLKFLDLPAKDYVCGFTLNTTYALNLVLSQLPTGAFRRVVTSAIEHNSVFLTTIELAKRLDVPRIVLDRSPDGTLLYNLEDLKDAVVVVNSVSNIDGRALHNIKELVKDTHRAGGIVVIDAAQTMAHYYGILQNCGADVICFSAHKMYSASLGGTIIRRDLLRRLSLKFVGGGMVASVSEDNYKLLPDDLASRLEPGLQAYGEIVALGEAVDWLGRVKPFGKKPNEYISGLSEQLFEGMKQNSKIEVLNNSPTPVVTVYPKDGDAHRLAIFLSGAGVMVRSGYFCCHYYLKEKKQLPPLLRFSVGLHSTPQDVQTAIEVMTKITKG